MQFNLLRITYALSLALALFISACQPQNNEDTEQHSTKGYVYYHEVKTTTPLSELKAKAQASLAKRSQLKLARNETQARQQYLQALDLWEAKHLEETEAILRRLAEQDYVDVQFDLYSFYSNKNEYKNVQEALLWLERALESGYPRAQYNYGLAHGWGISSEAGEWLLPQDWGKMADWVLIAAEQGDASAQSTLGFFYIRGEGLERNLIEAYKWLELSNERTSPPPAQFANNPTFRLNKNTSMQQQLIDKHGMTPEQVTEAKQLAIQWEANNPDAYQHENELLPIQSLRDRGLLK
ncbi:MAG: tetratricopeptide repeat protein [Cellvibrionaceae bacterium]